MAIKRAKCDQNGIKIAIFPEDYQKSPKGWGFAPRPPSLIRLSYTSMLAAHRASPNAFFENI